MVAAPLVDCFADLLRAPETLHPALWLGHQLGRVAVDAVGTGFAALDVELPGRGWPRRALSELLLERCGIGEMRLVAPALLDAQRNDRLVMAFDPPAGLSAEALLGLGVDVDSLLVVQAGGVAGDAFWALEQALKSGHVGAIVAWLTKRATPAQLRRLQLAAGRHDGAAFVFRAAAAANRPSPAPLRVVLRPAGPDRLSVSILKRRGPPLDAPLRLDLPAVLSNAARRRAGAGPPAVRSAPPLPATQLQGSGA